jgi:hypothetical protein
MTEEALDQLSFPGGPLPPSLRRWLEYDVTMLARSGWLPSSAAYGGRRP